MTWCWKLVNPLEDHVSVLDPPHGCATTKPFLSPIIRQNFTLNLSIMWRTKRDKGVFLFLNSYVHMKENVTCSLSFSEQAQTLCQAAFWPTRAELLKLSWIPAGIRRQTVDLKRQLFMAISCPQHSFKSIFKPGLGFGALPCLSASHKEAYAPTAKRRDWRSKDDEGDVRCLTLPQMYSRLVRSVENGSR